MCLLSKPATPSGGPAGRPLNAWFSVQCSVFRRQRAAVTIRDPSYAIVTCNLLQRVAYLGLVNGEYVMSELSTWADVLPVLPSITYVKPARARTAKPAHREATCDDLRALLATRGIKWTTAHTKAELRAIHLSGTYQRPAAYDRQNAKRKADRARQRAVELALCEAIAAIA